MRLHRACAAVALEAGDRPRAAYHLAQAAELVDRGSGLMPEPVPPGTAARLTAVAAALAGGDPAAQARVVIAAGFDGPRLDAVSADLAVARKLAEEVRDLPFYREEGHLATARLLVVTALAGDWDETAAFGEAVP